MLVSAVSNPTQSELSGVAAAHKLRFSYGREVGRWVLLLFGHLAVLTALYSTLYCFELVQLPTEQVIGRWDSGWYQYIRDHGYSYYEEKQSNVAFFPLFPYLWRFTGLGALGISIVNVLIGLGGIALLVAALRCTRRQGLLLASVPLLMFTWVPYTEALFYLFGALVLVGLHRQQLGWLLLGLLGCCLTRVAATFFVPALCFAEVLGWLESRAISKASLRTLGLGLLVMVGAVGSVLWLQHAQTGEWLGFYKTQRHWHHEWRLPVLWLRTSSNVRMMWLDVISLGVALSAAVVCLYLAGSRLRQLKASPSATGPTTSKAVSFALVYCVCVGTFTVFQQGGDISNISRYTLGTPFFAVLLWAAWQQPPSWPRWALGGSVAGVILYFFGFPAHLDSFKTPQAVWYFGLVIVYVVALLTVGSRFARLSFQRELSGVVYLFNTLMQACLLHWFMSVVWLG